MPKSKKRDLQAGLIGAALPVATVLLAVGNVPSALARDHKYEVVYNFQGGSDGANPVAGLIKDKAGNLYGTTSQGGASGHGTVFKLAPDGSKTVLYSFAGGSDGANPYAGVIQDNAGNLYGTTYGGGTAGYGTVFKLAPNGTETVLHTFTNVNDGGLPYASVLRDKAGNLYGTTYQGGANGSGFGTVFKLAKNGSFTTLYAFTGGSDGKNPDGGLIRDSAGNLYGTTIHGGGFSSGVVFKVAPDGAETVLYTFTENAGDGGLPIAGVIMDKAGNLYGTTAYGGTSENGTVFKLAPDGTETVLYSFAGGTDGSLPYAGLMMDGAGNLFGTTTAGGANFGVVFKLAPNGKETVLHTFGGYPVDGSTPLYGSLIKDADDGVGYLFGTTQGGGTDNGIAKGTIFKVHK